MSKSNGNGKVSASVETLSLDDMRRDLANQRNARPQSQMHINRLARAMRNDAYGLNGAAVVYDSSGRLVDGGHRLHAAILADKPLTTVVVRGIHEGMLEIDTGKRRSLTDVMRGRKVPNTKACATAVRIDYFVKRGYDPFMFNTDIAPTITDLMSHFGRMKRRTLEWAAQAATFDRKACLLPHGVATAVFYQLGIADQGKADEFVKRLMTGSNVKEGSPIYLCRRYFEGRKCHSTQDRRAAYGVLVKAWNYFVNNNNKVMLLYCKSSEELPAVETP